MRLGDPGSILLVSTYELGHAPHALATMAASLECAGFNPRCVDLAVDPLSAEAVHDASLIVFSTPMHTALRLALEALAALPEARTERRVAFVGMYAALHRAILADLGVDDVLAGEYETELVALAAALARGEIGDRPLISLARQTLPVPSRGQLPGLDRYARFIDSGGAAHLAGYSETTRGCLESCRHCPVPTIYGGRFFAVASRTVLADIEAQLDAGAEHITFGDPDFLNGPTHALRICRELHRRWPTVTFDFTAQVANLLEHRETVVELVGLGCAFAVTAVESLSDAVLARLEKRHRAADVHQLLHWADDVGLALRPTLVPFTPWTELGDIIELVDWIAGRGLEENVAPVQMSVRLLVPPGSLLFDPSRFGPLDTTALVHPWDHEDSRLDALARDIAALVETDADAERDERATHAEIRRLAHRAAERVPPPVAEMPRRRVPRVSEPWFC